MDKWGGRASGRDSDGWVGRGNRLSPWRGGNRRRNDDWEIPNQKRWRRDENPEWDEQQKSWKRGPVIDEEEDERKTMIQGPQWGQGVKKDESNYLKFRNRETNEERPRKQSKWGDKESENKVKEEQWNRKSVDHGLSSHESNTEQGPHRTSAPMDLDNYEGESVDNIEQLHGSEEQDTSNSNIKARRHEFKKDYHQDNEKKTHDLSNFNNSKTYDQTKEDNVEQHNNENKIFEDYQNDFTNTQELGVSSNIDEVQHNLEIQHKANNYEQQNIEEKHDSDFQKDSYANLNCEHEFETSNNNKEFEQNQHFEPNYNNVKYKNEQPNYDQSYEKELSHSSNSQDQHSSNKFMTQADETSIEIHRGDNSEESQGNLYFGSDNGSSINKFIVVKQQSNENLQMEETGMAPSDNNDVHAEESNQN